MGSFFVIKRDGSRAEFEIQRIINAIKKAASAVNIQDEMFCHKIGQLVCDNIFAHYQKKLILATFRRLLKII